MNAPANNDKVIDKIRKLLNHANDTAADSEHERDTAMRMALKLLAKHNLDMSDIADLEHKEDREMISAEHFPCPFRRIVAHAIAKLYFCEFYYQKVPNKQKSLFCFVGLESNAITASEMTKYLVKSLDLESARRLKENGMSTRWGTDFRNAAAHRIADRCETIRQEAETEQEAESTGTALVLANLYEQEEALNGNFIVQVLGITNLKKKTIRTKFVSGSAVAQGREFGDNVNLSNQLKDSTAKAKSAAPQQTAGLLN